MNIDPALWVNIIVGVVSLLAGHAGILQTILDLFLKGRQKQLTADDVNKLVGAALADIYKTKV